MFKSAIADQFYSEEGSFAAEANSTIEHFSTPLKKLPDSGINDIKNELHLHNEASEHQQRSISGHSAESQRAQLYKLILESDATAPSVSGSLKPLTDIPARFSHTVKHQNDLFKEELRTKADEAVFFKPLSIEGPVLPESFIPPPLKQTARNPFIISNNVPQNNHDDFEDLDDDEENVNSAPTGEWTSPVVVQALRRQVNKERIFKGVWHDTMRWVLFHMALLFASYFYRLYQLKFYDENRLYRDNTWTRLQKVAVVKNTFDFLDIAKHYVHYLQWIFILRIAIGMIQLLWPQDQCKDLPLSNKQRKLIGLKQINVGEDNEDAQADLAVKERLFESSQGQPIKVPKYRRLKDFSAYLQRNPKPAKEEEPSIALSNILPPTRLVRSGPPRSLHMVGGK